MLVYEQVLLPVVDYVDEHPGFIDPGTDTQSRAVGWHTGEVLRGVQVELGRFKEKLGEDGEKLGIEWRWIMLMGFAWEHYMVRRVKSESGTIWQPGEMGGETGLRGVSRDGRRLDVLYGNPDGYSQQVRWIGKGDSNGLIVPVLEEFKFTKMSSRKCPEYHWKWWAQVKAYLYVMQELYDLEHRWARLHACFVNADYAGFGKDGDGGEPYVCSWWVEFTQQELKDNWALLTGWMDRQR